MTARLMVREVGQREFIAHNGDYEDDPPLPERMSASDEYDGCWSDALTKALTEGSRLCASGNVEAFQVWSLVTTKQRVWALEEVEA